MKQLYGYIALTLSALASCCVQAIPIPDNLDDALQQLIQQHGLTGEPTKGITIPDIHSSEAQLGKLLFFSKALSGNQDVACASCHHPYLGGGDGLALAVGTLAIDEDIMGSGRQTTTGEYYVPRNTPSIFNSALYQRGLFRDARVEFLDWLKPEKGISTPDVPYGEADPNAGETLVAAQARFPVVTESEMRGFDFMQGYSNQAVRAHLAARIGDYDSAQGELIQNRWYPLFASVYGDKPAKEIVTFANITRALAAYQRSMNFVNNPWNAYVKGDKDAISESQKRGAYLYLFMPPPPSDGGTEPDYLPTQCIGCHNTDSFTQTKGSNYHRLAFPQIGPGTGTLDQPSNDLGRTQRNNNNDDLYSFRSGTLLNIEVTGPYGHAGSYDTLMQVIEHYDDYHQVLDDYIDNQGWCQQPQFKSIARCQDLFPDARYNTDLAAKIIDDEIEDGAPVLQKLYLSRQAKEDLVNFMKALTDPCVKDARCLAPWIPSREDIDPDGLRLQPLNYQQVPLYLPKKCNQAMPLSSGSELQPNQGECISGSTVYLYFDIEKDNSNIFISTRDGSGNLTLYYHPNTWAMPDNAVTQSAGAGTEQKLVLTLNKGRHYVSAVSRSQFDKVSIAVGVLDARKPNKPSDMAVPNACLTQQAQSFAELHSGKPVCLAANDSYFYIKITEPNSTLTLKARHGVGNTDLLVGTYWPSRGDYQFSSQSADNAEYLKLHLSRPGWYYVLATGEGTNQGVTLQADIN
ncbi:cytochrome-c peroxidase [Pseudoalteromonas piscicida]|uniref:cytochrome-c peroxidase n=1 Tax=Pseudoalteromonas piscicida TaxID=43662 RepID=UPI0030B3D8B8